ncbi:polysaccharide ABC transporter ATP-binding protein [Thermodesulfobacteriota bacterium]
MSTVIRIENLWKEYRLGVIGHGTLARDLQSWWARARGKEDPNSIIPLMKGQEKQIEGDRFWALRGIDLEVKQGEILGIIGMNGAGKSTLLKILSRVTAPTQGQVKVKGRIASLLEVGTGFHPELTGRENIFLNGAILGMSKQEIMSKLDEIVDFSGIDDFIDTPVKRYSSGMYVRLAFAVAAHLEPEILVVDEVLAVGDAEFQKKCLGKMNTISEMGKTLLFVSHQMNAIESICTSGIIIDQGRVAFKSGNIREVTNHYIKDENENSTDSVFWEPKDNKFGNPYFNPIKFYITNEDGNIINIPLKNDSDIYVNIEFMVDVLDSALIFGYDVFDSANTQIFTSSQADGRDTDWPTIKTGHNHVKSKIPRHFLNEGDYYLKLAASLSRRIWLVNPYEVDVRINLKIRGGLSESPYWTVKRGGIVAPILKWYVV